VLQGNFGNCYVSGPIKDIFAQRLPITSTYLFVAFIISTFLGISAGIICAIRRGGLLDQLVSLSANIGIAVPVFWLGILGIYLFGLRLGWLPIRMDFASR